VIDEFAELASPQFAGFIRMARGSKIGIIMAHQELADLEAISPELRDQVVGNAATTVSFLQKNPRSAQMMADIAGTRTTVKRTKQLQKGFLFESYSGAESEREVEEYLVHPNQIKTLRVGECFVISKHPISRQARIKVSPLERPASNVDLEALLGHRGDEMEEPVERDAIPAPGLKSDLPDKGCHADEGFF
jgi:type IV secretory pathway TraG/TraD family ATPase VirD4